MGQQRSSAVSGYFSSAESVRLFRSLIVVKDAMSSEVVIEEDDDEEPPMIFALLMSPPTLLLLLQPIHGFAPSALSQSDETRVQKFRKSHSSVQLCLPQTS